MTAIPIQSQSDQGPFQAISEQIISSLFGLGYYLKKEMESGLFFISSKGKLPILIDVGICSHAALQYVDYTRFQNELMHEHKGVLRFVVQTMADATTLPEEIKFILDEEETELPNGGFTERIEEHLDCSMPEGQFESLFGQAFGDAALHALRREEPFCDFEGTTRFVDYMLSTHGQRIAIELNGEQFHHPACIGLVKYRSQLLKQNSLVKAGHPVFRWSLRGMADNNRFIEEMRRFFGDATHFQISPRQIVEGKFSLLQHQTNVLEAIRQQREMGRNRFLIVLPTGLGKTEIFFEDFQTMKTRKPDLNGLLLTPTTPLKRDMLQRVQTRLASFNHGFNYQPPAPGAGFMIQTYAHFIRHFEDYSPDAFGYIVVDEAHHSVAPGLGRALRHFQPLCLVGATATPERMDQKKLEEIFGSYETNISLAEAIEQGLMPPIRAFRIETNIDLSEVRFNGIDYVQKDLQKRLLTPSRDQLVAGILKRFFLAAVGAKQKQGIIFCANVEHAQRMSRVLEEAGFLARAVSGQDSAGAEEAVKLYRARSIQFLCACNLLSEGWDCPQTEIIVMARPTMSKVLYLQQLGRGTRKYPGKDALYVLDVVDRAGPWNAPWTLHALFKIQQYSPWAPVLKNSSIPTGPDHKLILDWLVESERVIKEIDIFTFEQKYEGYLNQEQLARELFVSSGTVMNWVKKGEINVDVTVPFGKLKLLFFAPESVEKIRLKKNLKKHDESTQLDDLLAFVKEGDYTFSYKMIFLLALTSLQNQRGEANFDEVAKAYQGFYADRLAQKLPVDRPLSPYNDADYLLNLAEIKRSILLNPFEKFERKRFMHHCKDLAYIAWSSSLWASLERDPRLIAAMQEQMTKDLLQHYANLGGIGEGQYLRNNFPSTAQFLPQTSAEKEIPNLIKLLDAPATATCVPFLPIHAAAGIFEFDANDSQNWIDVAEYGYAKTINNEMFVIKVVGKSMEPRIPDGAYCLFNRQVAASRNGRILLIEKRDYKDVEWGGHYTVKKYRSEKTIDEDGWHHSRIELIPLNKSFPIISFTLQDEAELRVLGEFVAELRIP